MKSLFLTLLIFTGCASHVAAQTPRIRRPAPASSNQLYTLGNRDVSIPPPKGFVEATSRSEDVKRVFEATEAAGLDTLAVHVPADVMEKIIWGERPELEFYTKVSVAKILRNVDSSQADFAKGVSYLRANNARMFDFTRPEFQSQFKKQNEGLSELLKRDTKIDLAQPASLGEIENTRNSYGTLLLTKVRIQSGSIDKERILLMGASVVRIRERMVWIYTYRVFNSDKDTDILKAFTKRWLADILRANLK